MAILLSHQAANKKSVIAFSSNLLLKLCEVEKTKNILIVTLVLFFMFC